MTATTPRLPVTALGLLLGVLAWLMFAINLGVPNKPVFDEIYYVEAARGLLRLDAPYNIEHPLMGKMLIAAGIALFGDNGFGWRFFSSVAGAATVVAVFAIAWQLFGRARLALCAALVTLFNFTLFIQARIAMLDGFMAAFLLLAIAASIAATRAHGGAAWRWLGAAGVFFGFAVASKWAAAPFVALAAVALWRAGGTIGKRPFAMLALLFGASIGVYFLSFLPAFFYRYDPLTLAGLLDFQWRMYLAQTAPLPRHPYQSGWWSWPLDARPIWYLYEKVDGAQRGILMLGNPFVLWGGLIAVGLCLWAGVRANDRALRLVGLLWLASFGIWVLIPKKIGFFYYYYLPSLILPLAIIGAVDRYLAPRWRFAHETAVLASFALFLWFFPIISAAPLADDQAFLKWMWFDSWR